jgi:hypothetical protein
MGKRTRPPSVNCKGKQFPEGLLRATVGGKPSQDQSFKRAFFISSEKNYFPFFILLGQIPIYMGCLKIQYTHQNIIWMPKL